MVCHDRSRLSPQATQWHWDLRFTGWAMEENPYEPPNVPAERQASGWIGWHWLLVLALLSVVAFLLVLAAAIGAYGGMNL